MCWATSRAVQGSNPGQVRDFFWEFCFAVPLAHSAMMSTLSEGRWDGEGEDWPSTFFAEAKKMKSLTLHTNGCLSFILRDWWTILIIVDLMWLDLCCLINSAMMWSSDFCVLLGHNASTEIMAKDIVVVVVESTVEIVERNSDVQNNNRWCASNCFETVFRRKPFQRRSGITFWMSIVNSLSIQFRFFIYLPVSWILLKLNTARNDSVSMSCAQAILL